MKLHIFNTPKLIYQDFIIEEITDICTVSITEILDNITITSKPQHIKSIKPLDTDYISILTDILSENTFRVELPLLGTHKIDEGIINFIKDLQQKIKTDDIKNISDIFIKLFKDYLHNRIGTSLLVSEKELTNSSYKPELKKGQLLIYRHRFDSYKWVIYKDIENNKKHTIITKTENKFEEKTININSLMGYSSSENISLTNITEENIIEKYYFGNIV